MPDFADNELVNIKKRGRPVGTPGGGKYGCTTTVVRVPVDIAPNIKKIVNLYQSLDDKVNDWANRIETAGTQSKTGNPSPRYERAIELLTELRELLKEDE